MILIAIFAIYVIVTKRLRITRSITVTGTRARNFGITLFVTALPISVAVGKLLRSIFPLLPVSFRGWPWPSLASVTLFCGSILVMALYFRDLPEEPEPSATVSEASQTGAP